MARISRANFKRKIANFIVDSFAYFLLSFVFFIKINSFKYNHNSLVWSVSWLPYVNGAITIATLKWISYLSPFLTLISRTRFMGQALCFFSIFFLLSISYSNGKVYHSVTAWIFFIPIYWISHFFSTKERAVHIAFFAVTLSYFNAGIWKARTLFPYLYKTNDFNILYHILPEHIAYASIERMKPPLYLGELLMDHPSLSFIAWILVITVEIGSITFIFIKKNTFIYPLILSLFHLGVYLTMRINFLTTTALLVMLTVYFFLIKDDTSIS